MTDSELPTSPGVIIAGKYRVEAVIGEGGMGAIVRARHIALNRDVAIKLMRNEISGVHKASERFLREARATANIESDYVAHVSDIDVLPNGIPFIVMEFLDGVDLATHVTAKRQREVTEAVDWMLQTLSGLAAAHELGIVHRDLKPTNLFLAKRADGSRRIKVLDFGVSKVLDDSDFSREGHNDGLTTTSNFVVGTPRYMAPEQITAPRDVDERADLWAVGLILYEFLVGAHPFDGKTPGAIMGHVLATPILPIDSFRSDVPLELAKIVERCLKRDRAQRYATAHDLLKALAPFGSPRLSASLIAALPPPSIRAPAPQAPFVAGGFAAVTPERAPREASGEGSHTAVQGSGQPQSAREASTVHTPSGFNVEAAGPQSLPVLLERSQTKPSQTKPSQTKPSQTKPSAQTPLTGSPVAASTGAGVAGGQAAPGSSPGSSGAGPTRAPDSSSPNADPGTLNAWHREQRGEGSKLAWVFGGVTLLGALALGGWVLLAQPSSRSDFSPTSSAPIEGAALGGPMGNQPPPTATVAPTEVEDAERRAEPSVNPPSTNPQSASPSSTTAPPQPPNAVATVVVAPPPAAPPPVTPRVKPKTKASSTAAPAAPPAALTPQEKPPAPAPSPVEKPANPVPTATEQTRPSKDSILGTRN